MSLLTRDQILAANDLKSRDVDVPEWGGTVRVRELTGDERDSVELSMVTMRGSEPVLNPDAYRSFRARLSAMSIVGEDGQRVFTDADMLELGKKSSAALQRVFNVAMELSAFTKKDVEELVGKSEAAPSGDSPSDSVSPSA
jgi:hypothetical protein